MLTNLLLPSTWQRLDDIEIADKTITVRVASTATQTECPGCGHLAQRGHSQYTRTLVDLPLSGQRVQLRLQVTRFFCDNPHCQRKTFTERLPDFAPRSARRTKRLADIQTVIGLALGGEAGARLVRHLEMPTSPDTLLRLTRRKQARGAPTPRVLGIDDWAWKKGREYGTILVDLERQCPVDLLPDRTAETLAAWLKEHPGIEIISRDRAGAYADGAARGAPDAVQVADRWHLLVNMRETVQRLLDRHQKSLPVLRLPQTEPEQSEAPHNPAEPDTKATARESDVLPQLTRAQRSRQERRARRLDRFAQVVALRQCGVSMRAISEQLGLDRRTVRRYVRADAFPEIAERQPRPSILDPWKPCLRQRWDEGCHNGSRLLSEIKSQGYRGSRALLGTWVADLRKTLAPPDQPTRVTVEGRHAPIALPTATRRLSAKQAAWLMVKQPDKLTAEGRDALAKMRQACGDIEQTYSLAQAFGQLIRERNHQEFDHWVESARATEIRELKSFAAGLVRDKSAVVAALSLPWSNGQVKGQVNRLKLIKRSMYGRANFDLLRQRVLDTG